MQRKSRESSEIVRTIRTGVLDFPKVCPVLSAVSDSQYSVVELLAASARQHTRAVMLERRLVGLDGDGDWLLGDSVHERRDGALLDVGIGGRGRSRDGLRFQRRIASGHLTGATDIGVSILGDNATVRLGPFECLVHPATVASVIQVIARHKDLLGERGEGASLDLVGSLESTGGGEGPTGSALSLVLDRSDGTGGNPIDRVRALGGGLAVHLGVLAKRRRLGGKAHYLLPLRVGQVRELVEAHGKGLLFVAVVLLDDFKVGGESLDALDELLAIGKVEVVLHHVLVKELLLSSKCQKKWKIRMLVSS